MHGTRPSSLLGVVGGGAVTYATQRGLDGRRGRREREAIADESAANDSELTKPEVAGSNAVRRLRVQNGISLRGAVFWLRILGN